VDIRLAKPLALPCGLKKKWLVAGHTWKDFAVAGGGGESCHDSSKSLVAIGRQSLLLRLKSKVQLLQEWGRSRLLTNLDDVAKAASGCCSCLALLSRLPMKYDGRIMLARQLTFTV